MRIKPLLVSTAFISTLFATTALAPDALAQKGAVYTPQTDWAITKVEGANGYCALARRFDRNTILTIARNKMSEASLALDFQRPKFQVGQTVHVVLDPGAGQQRSYDASPASANAFVLRLGQDAPFFGALKKTGYLRAEIAGKSYSFNLADIDAGQDDLSACVVSMTQPAAGDVDITPAPTFGGSKAARTRALESENETLRLKLASVKSADAIPSAASNQNVARLQAENARLQSSLNLAQGNASATQQLQAEIAALRAQNEKFKKLTAASAPEGQRGLVGTLTDENRRLQQELDKLSAALPSKAAPAKIDGRLAALETENAKLRRALDNGANNATDNSALEAELSSLRSENRSLQQRLASAEQATPNVDGLNNQLTVLREENARLKGQINVAKQDVRASFEDRIRHFEFENKNLKAALDGKGADTGLVAQLRQQLGQAQNENRLLQQTASLAREQAIEEKEFEINALKQRLSDAGPDLEAAETLTQQLEKAIKERNAFKQTAKAQREKISSLQDAVSGAGANSSKLASLEGELGALSAENDQLRTEVEMAAKAADAKNAVQIASLSAENAQLKSEIEVASQAVDAGNMAQIAALEEKNQTLAAQIEEYADQAESLQSAKVELEELRGEKDTLVQELAALSDNEGLSSKALDEALAQNEVLKSEVEQKAAALQTLAELDVKLKTMSEENQALQATIEEQSVKLASAALSDNVIAELQGENAALQEQILAFADVPVDERAAQTIAALKEENEEITDSLRLAEAEVQNYEARFNEAKSENVALRQNLAQAETFIKTRVMASASPEQMKEPTPTPAPQKIAALGTKPVAVKAPSAPKPTSKPQAAQKVAELQAAAREERARVAAARVPAAAEADDAMAAALNDMMPAAGDENADSGLAPEDILAAGAQEPPNPNDIIPQAAIEVEDVVVEPQYAAGLSEAQRLEQSLMNQLDDGAAPIAARQSEDPFEDIDVAAPAMEAAVANAPEIKVQALPDAAINDAVEQELKQAIAEAERTEVIQRAEPDVAQALIQAGQAPAPEAQAQDIAAKAEMAVEQPRAVIEGAPKSLDTASIEPVPTSGTFSPSFTMANMLSSASIAADTVSLVEKASNADRVVHQWSSETVYGSSEQKPLRNAGDFENYVRDYLTKTEDRCQGDFAIVPDNSTQNGATRIDSYEVACVGASVNSSASLLFFNKDDTFTVVAHEAPTEKMDTAMALRDRLIDSVSGS